MSWFKNPLDFAEGLLDQVDKRVSSVVGPSSNEDESERPKPASLPPAPPKSAWEDHHDNVIATPEPKRSTPTASPQRSPAPTRSGTLKLPRKLPPRTSPATTSDSVPAAGSASGGKLTPASSLDTASKPATTSATQKHDSSVPRTLPRPSPSPAIDRSLPAPAAASDLASSPPVAAKSPPKRLPPKNRTTVSPANEPLPNEQPDPSEASDEGAGWLATAPKQPLTSGRSPKAAHESSASPKALHPPSDHTPAPNDTSGPSSALTGSFEQQASSPKVFAKTEQASTASPARSPVKNASLSATTGDIGASMAAFSSNGNGLDSSRPSQDVLTLPVPTQYTAESSEERESPQADVTLDAGSEKLMEKLKQEQEARKNIAQEVSRLREELMAAQGRAAVAEAGLAESRDDLATMEDRVAAAEDAAARADDALSHAQQSAGDAAGTAAAATAAAEARAAAAAEAASAARSKAREAMERADLKADALRSCEARLGQLESELEQASSARDAAVAEASKLRAEAAATAERAVMQGNEAVDSLQKELNAARQAAAAAQADAQAERSSAAEARITAERRLADMESALGVAHAEASQSTRAAEEAVEALEAAEAANASLQQRLAEAAVGSPKQESSGSFELQARLESTEARCMELEQGARHSQHRVEELELELAEQRTGTARHAVHELQGQLKQANQLLAERQALWERSAAEHAARSLTLERQLAQAQDKLQAAGRQAHTGGDRRSGVLSVPGEDVVPMDSLHGYYRFVSHRRFGKAFKAIGGSVDSVTAQVVAVLRRNPIARVAMLLYIVFVHLLIYVLIGRMQHHAAASVSHTHPGVDVTGTLSRFDTPINKVQQP